MLRRLRKKIKGQTTIEYAILLALVAGAVIAMQTYVKRGFQAKTKDTVGWFVGQTNELGTSFQYEPYYLESSFNTERDSSMSSGLAVNEVTQNGTQNITRDTAGYQQMDYNADVEGWTIP